MLTSLRHTDLISFHPHLKIDVQINATNIHNKKFEHIEERVATNTKQFEKHGNLLLFSNAAIIQIHEIIDD